MLHNKNILVTGGAGFIGSHLCEELVRTCNNVTIVDNLSTGTKHNLNHIYDKIKLIVMDVLTPDFEKMLGAEKFDIIYHLAGTSYVPPSVTNPASDFKNTLCATFSMLNIIRKNKIPCQFIYVSSAAVYGNPVKLPINELDPTVPISPYGVAKLAAERYVCVFSQLYKINAASLRFFSVYGPRQKKQIVYDFMDKLTRNPKELTIIGDGGQKRDMIYVKDVVQALLKVTQNGELKGEVYNVATGKSYSTFEMAKTMIEFMRVNPELIFTGNVRPGDAEEWVADIARLKAVGFSPQFLLQDGLGETINWYQMKRSNT